MYLQAATDLLVQHLSAVANAWRPEASDGFREHLLAQPSDEALALILKGVGTLVAVELAGERLLVAYETKDQEDEHSCFSDNTHNDIIGNLLGVENVLSGRLQGVDGTTWRGTGLLDVVAAVDTALAQRTGQRPDARRWPARGPSPPRSIRPSWATIGPRAAARLPQASRRCERRATCWPGRARCWGCHPRGPRCAP